MAEFGIRVVNPNSNTVLIDGQYANLALKMKGTTTTSTSMPDGWGFTVTVTGGGNPIIAINCAQYCFIGSSSSSGGVTTFNVITLVNGASVDWYVFDDPVNCTPTPANWGVIVRNKTTGKVVFDSRMKYMRVVGFETGRDATQADPFLSKTYPATKVAVLQSQKTFFSDIRELPGTFPPTLMIFVYNAGVRAQGASVQWSYVLTQQFEDTTAPPALSQQWYSYLVLDVSNY